MIQVCASILGFRDRAGAGVHVADEIRHPGGSGDDLPLAAIGRLGERPTCQFVENQRPNPPFDRHKLKHADHQRTQLEVMSGERVCFRRSFAHDEVRGEIGPHQAIHPPAAVEHDAGCCVAYRHRLPFADHVLLAHGRFELHPST